MSNFLRLNFREVLRAFIVAVGTALVQSVYAYSSSGSMPTIAQLKVAGFSALCAGFITISHDFLSGPKAVQEEPK